MFALELFVVPLRDFSVCKQGVVAAGEASLHTLRDIVVEREVGAEGVVRVLPVAILRFVDRLKMVSDVISAHSPAKEYSQTIHQPKDQTAE